MARFEMLKGVFGLLPTPYTDDLEIHTSDLRAVADFCCKSGQHGIVWPVMVGEFYYLGEEERIKNLNEVLEEIDILEIYAGNILCNPECTDRVEAAKHRNRNFFIASWIAL